MGGGNDATGIYVNLSIELKGWVATTPKVYTIKVQTNRYTRRTTPLAAIIDQMTDIFCFVDDFLKAHTGLAHWRTSHNAKVAEIVGYNKAETAQLQSAPLWHRFGLTNSILRLT